VDLLRTKRSLHRGFGDALSNAFEFAVTIAVFMGGGWLLDRWLHTRPAFTIALVVFALVGFSAKLWYAYEAKMKQHEAEMTQVITR